MTIPRDILESYFCKYEQKYFEDFNKKISERGIPPVTYEQYFELLKQMSEEDEWMTPYLPPRVR